MRRRKRSPGLEWCTGNRFFLNIYKNEKKKYGTRVVYKPTAKKTKTC